MLLGGDQRGTKHHQRDRKKAEQMRGSPPFLVFVQKCTRRGQAAPSLPLRSNKSPLSNKPRKSTRLVACGWIEGMIKGSVYVYIFYMYTHDKDIITEGPSAPIFICASNEKNRIHVQEGESRRVGSSVERARRRRGVDGKRWGVLQKLSSTL